MMTQKTCLAVGDGNLSFSLSLLNRQLHVPLKLVATSFQEEDHVIRCPHTSHNTEELLKRGVIIIHQVDGTNLDQSERFSQLGLKYDVIYFNFPHTGRKSQIKKNRQLVEKFFRSVTKHLAGDGRVVVALCQGQGGTPVDCQKRGYENSWKVVEMAAEAGLILTRVGPFQSVDYPGYLPTGYRGQSKAFLLVGALEHTFGFPGVSQSLFPPVYTHDISFWCSQGQFDEFELVTVVEQATEGNVQSLNCIGVYKPVDDPSDRISYCYRLRYCSLGGVLSRSRARNLQLHVRQLLEQQLGLTLR